MNAFDMLFKIQELQLTREMLESAKPLSAEAKTDLVMTTADKIQQKHDQWEYDRCIELARKVVG